MNGKIYERIEVKEGMNPILLSKSFLKISVPIEYYHIADSYAMVWNIDYDNFLSVISSSTIDFQHYFSIVHKHSYTN